MNEELENKNEAYRIFITERDYLVNPFSEVRLLYKEYVLDSILEIERETYYDKDGRIKEQFVFDLAANSYSHKDGDYSNKHSFFLNEQGVLVKETDLDELGGLNWSTDFLYDPAGRLVSERTLFNDRTDESRKFYDDNGKIVEIIYLRNGFVKNVTKYKHNDNIEVEYNLDSEGNQIQRWERTYNQNDLPEEIIEFDKHNYKFRIDRYKYDSSNEVVLHETVFGNNSLIEKIEKEFDLVNRISKKTIRNYKNGTLVSETILEYEYLDT